MSLSMWRASWSAGDFCPSGGGGVAGLATLVGAAGGFLVGFWAKAAGGVPRRAARKRARVRLPSRRTRSGLCIVTVSGGAFMHVEGEMRQHQAARSALVQHRVLAKVSPPARDLSLLADRGGGH